MNENDRTLLERAPDRQEPKVGVVYWVQCKSYRTRAIMDKDGKWKSLFNGRELPDVASFFID